MTPEEIFLKRQAQHGTTEQSNEWRAEASETFIRDMKQMLKVAHYSKMHKENILKVHETRRKNKAGINYEGTPNG